MLRCMSYSIIVLFLLPCLSYNLPSYFPKCYRDDPELSECMLRAFNKMQDRARNGIDEIGLPALYKIVTPLVIISQEKAIANLTVAISNYTLEGLDYFDIKMFHYNLETMTIRVRVEFDSLVVSAYSNGEAYVAYTDLQGTGYARCIIDSVNATFEIKGELRQSNATDYYNTKDVSVYVDINDILCNLEGFFDNNEQLNAMANEMLTTNSKLLVEAAIPLVRKLAEAGITTFMKDFTNEIPYNEILPSRN